MLRIKKVILLFILLVGMQNSLVHCSLIDMLTPRRAFSFAVLGAAGIGAYMVGPQIYTVIQDQVNAKIEQELSDSITLICTPNSSINKLPQLERDKLFKKKARLVNARIRILKRLAFASESRTDVLSEKHKDQLKIIVQKSSSIFDPIDFIRGLFCVKNPYEDDYKQPSFIDQIIEDKIFNDIL